MEIEQFEAKRPITLMWEFATFTFSMEIEQLQNVDLCGTSLFVIDISTNLATIVNVMIKPVMIKPL